MDDLAIYYFHQGTSAKAYEFLGAHYEDNQTTFRVWAPHAKYVSVVGDFNNWDLNASLMNKINNEGIFEVTIKNVKEYDDYQYAITTYDGRLIYKVDPYAFHAEMHYAKHSKVYNLNGYTFEDDKWIKNRHLIQNYSSPLNIYELHLGSWKVHEDGTHLNYVEIANNLVPYLKQMNYTHVEIMPISEYPYDPSWGYQVTGYYSVTYRYGTPKDFMKFVDILHQNNIGVILDWVPGHFNKDSEALIEFDGYPLYEPSNPKKQENKGWGTRCFDYGRCEIQSFLVSNAIFWIEKFHIDGLRVDAVSSMLYLDYERNDGEWEPNSYGTNINLEALALIKKVNDTVHEMYPSVLMIAEESTAYPGITTPIKDGGLGFDYKWNMGWMNDALKYIAIDPYFKGDNFNLITFQLTYIFSEHYILAISHDEVVHLKKALISKMPGNYDEMFSCLKTYMTYLMTHPGKKLLFMGGEIGQFNEWDEKKSIEWELLKYPKHDSLRKFNSDLNELYLKYPSLYNDTTYWDGFKWDVVDDKYHAVFAYERHFADEIILSIMNFSNCEWNGYTFNTTPGKYELLICSEDEQYGGYKKIDKKIKYNSNGQITLDLPAHSGMILRKE